MSLPVRGAWIEMTLGTLMTRYLPSLPVRGAWIEMAMKSCSAQTDFVAPRAGSVD